MKKGKFDFSGYATKNNLRCSDGRVIKKNAFKKNDNTRVPLVWQHQHDDPSNVLGHAMLENREDGVYAYCKFNDTDNAGVAKELVKHKDIVSLSIYANGLVQEGSNVVHGMIKEVSLVLSGANPGAFIDNISLSHGDDEADFSEAIIYTGELIHAESSKPSKKSDKKSSNDDEEDEDEEITQEDEDEEETKPKKSSKKKSKKKDDEEISHADNEDEDDEENIDDEDEDGESLRDIFNTLSPKQKDMVYALLANSAEHSDIQGGTNMKKNVFEKQDEQTTLSHSEMQQIIKDGIEFGSLKDAVLEHAAQYGIDKIDVLFPDAKAVNSEPILISRDMTWVKMVLNGTKHSPFARIKSTAADITAEEARAKGYVKGKKKVEEVIKALKRVTGPTTVYKKQKLDRDDIIDITDFNVVTFLKKEMRMMLDEELARAILVGDGREITSQDKINEDNIRPIWKDDEVFATKITFEKADFNPDAFIKGVLRARTEYRGSGRPSLYIHPDLLTELLLIEDKMGRRIYESEQALATAMRVKEIVEVPVMENITRDDAGTKIDLVAIVVNLNDYTVGADQGGSISMFDDFDIDFNQYKYLIETRCSGALTIPKSALVFEKKQQ